MSIVPRISHGILSLNVETKEDLHNAYMPFITNGGIFVPTLHSYQLGEEVFMLLTIMDEAEKIPITGNVIWVTPQAAQGGKKPGIGVQFSPEDTTVVKKIETFLTGFSNTERRTHTL